MQIESSNHSQEKDYSQSMKIEQENNNCKDGFCTLPNQNKKPRIKTNTVNLFDPI